MRTATICIALLLATGSALAFDPDPRAVALGYQTEHADVVAVGSLGSKEAGRVPGTIEATFALTRVIRGDAPAGATVVVVCLEADHEGARPIGSEYLLFLSRFGEVRPSGLQHYRPVTGPYGVRRIEQWPRGPEMAERIAATLARADHPADPDALLELLLGWMGDPEPAVAWSAATDFAYREDLHRLLTAASRARVLAAYRNHPIGKTSKDALALALAAARPPEAGRALVESLLLEEGLRLRRPVADALVRLADPSVPGLLSKALVGCDEETRAVLVQVLGAVGGSEALATVFKLVADTSPGVRVQAAHALGQIARRVREEVPGTRVAGRLELVGLLGSATTENELEASLWALAQLDDPAAFAVLRGLAEKDPRDFVRRHAKRYLDRPRLSLILD